MVQNVIGTLERATDRRIRTATPENQRHNQILDTPYGQEEQHVFRTRTAIIDFCQENPPSFQGSMRVDIVDDWKESMKKIFERLKCTDKEKVRVSIYRLEASCSDMVGS